MKNDIVYSGLTYRCWRTMQTDYAIKHLHHYGSHQTSFVTCFSLQHGRQLAWPKLIYLAFKILLKGYIYCDHSWQSAFTFTSPINTEHLSVIWCSYSCVCTCVHIICINELTLNFIIGVLFFDNLKPVWNIFFLRILALLLQSTCFWQA